MGLTKEKNVYIILVFLLILSYLFLFYNRSFHVTTCTLEKTEENYKRKISISIRYKNNKTKYLLYEDILESDYEDILLIKKQEFIKNSYTIKSKKKKISGKKKEKIIKNYKTVLEDILASGYTCTE